MAMQQPPRLCQNHSLSLHPIRPYMVFYDIYSSRALRLCPFLRALVTCEPFGGSGQRDAHPRAGAGGNADT